MIVTNKQMAPVHRLLISQKILREKILRSHEHFSITCDQFLSYDFSEKTPSKPVLISFHIWYNRVYGTIWLVSPNDKDQSCAIRYKYYIFPDNQDNKSYLYLTQLLAFTEGSDFIREKV